MATQMTRLGTKKSARIQAAKNAETARRLKVVRTLLEITQAQFAERLGVSYDLVLAVENRRKMTPDFAERVMRATGVRPDWLLANEGSTDAPKSVLGLPLGAHDLRRPPAKIVDPLSPESMCIDDFCRSLAELLRAAERKNRFGIAAYYVMKMLDAAKHDLKLKALALEESEYNVPLWLYRDHRFGEEFDYPNGVRADDLYVTWRMLSPSARVQWSNAIADTDRKRFVADIGRIQKAVEASFNARQKRQSCVPKPLAKKA
jgi:transcriptional regulator with XRE-family HTH domain